ncbi:MAG: DUF998 domain-containing protein [Conexivisphaerales archaeon]
MKLYRLVGLVASVLPYPFIIVSMLLSPWFNMYEDALSDLGNLNNGLAARIYDSGLTLGGVFVILFSLMLMRGNRGKHFVTVGTLISFIGIALALIGLFPENAGEIHGIISTFFFGLIVVSMIIYGYLSWPLGSPITGLLATLFGIVAASVWFIKWPWSGIAIQETFTSLLASFWLLQVSVLLLRDKDTPKV